MTARDDRDRRIRAFLDEGLTELPDRSFDAVRASIERTRQRTFFGLRRTNQMPVLFRPAAMAAALVGIAVIGVLLVNRPALPPGGTPAPTTTATSDTPTSVPTTVPTSVFLPYEWPGELASGTYATTFTWKNPFQIAVTVPEGWQSRDIEVIKGVAMSVSVQLVDNIYPDPCTPVLGTQPIGPSVDDLVAAIRSIDRIEVGTPVTTTRSGFDGKAFSYTPAAALCGGPEGRLWHHPEDLIEDSGHFIQPTWPLRAGTHRVEIYDVNGRRLLIDAMAPPDATQDQIDELTGVLESLRILAQPTARLSGDCNFTLASPADPAADLGPPFRIAMGMRRFDLNGVHPEEPSTGLPSAQVDFLVSEIDFTNPLPDGARPTAEAVPPIDTLARGFATLMPGPGSSQAEATYIGSWVMDAPGTWWGAFYVSADCAHRIPIEVLPVPGG